MSAIGTMGASMTAGGFGGATTLTRADLLASAEQSTAPGPPQSDATEETFQEFVAGTFFQQMFKAMRQTQKKPKYFHGGKAEEIFQSQLDQQFSQELAKSHGAAFSNDLYKPFLNNLGSRLQVDV